VSDSYDSVQAEQDFFRARQKALMSSIFARFRGQNTDLLSFEEVKGLLKPTDESYKGHLTIKIKDIVGSEGRYQDFDRRFLPRSSGTKSRWQRIFIAHERDINLPPILVYELAGVYFIRDGNHRVSVHRRRGGEYIEAEVTSISTKIDVGPVRNRDELREKVIAYEREQFISALNLMDTFPQTEFRFTTTGRYDDLVVHIACRKQLIEDRRTTRISYEEAARSWYMSVYLPVTKLIRDSGIIAILPDRTEADFYVWLIRNWDNANRRSKLRRRFRSSF
jgi:hypothetical protein